jgi:hypothetical protein
LAALEYWIQADAFGGRDLQVAEEGVARGIRTREEHADPAQGRAEKGKRTPVVAKASPKVAVAPQ